MKVMVMLNSLASLRCTSDNPSPFATQSVTAFFCSFVSSMGVILAELVWSCKDQDCRAIVVDVVIDVALCGGDVYHLPGRFEFDQARGARK